MLELRNRIKQWIVLSVVATVSISSVQANEPNIRDYDAEFLDEELKRPDFVADDYARLMQSEAERKAGLTEGVVQTLDEFVLRKVEIKNNSVLKPEEMEVAYKRYLNTRVKMVHLQDIAQVITQIYQDKGYFLSFALIPTQDVSEGTLTVLAIEGIIDDVYIKDKTPESQSKLMLTYAKKMIQEKPLTRESYFNFLYKAEKLPGIKVKPNLVPSQDTIAASTLVLKVKEKPVNVYFMDTNHMSTRYGSHMDFFKVQYNSIPNSFRSNFNVSTSNPLEKNRFALYKLEHKHYVGRNGAYWMFKASKSRVKPIFKNDSFNSLNYQGESQGGKFTFMYPLRETFAHEFRVAMNLVAKNSSVQFGGRKRREDKIRLFNFGFDYSNRVLRFFNSPSDLNFKAFFEQNTKALGASRDLNALPLSVAGTRPDGSRVFGSANWLQPIGESGLYLNLLVEGQKGFNKMLNYGKFSYGGMALGRGYAASIISGDSGVSTLFELNYLASNPYWFNYFQPAISYDVGKVWKHGYLAANDPRTESAASVSAGFRAALFKKLHMNLYLSKVLTHVNEVGSKPYRVFYSLFVNI